MRIFEVLVFSALFSISQSEFCFSQINDTSLSKNAEIQSNENDVYNDSIYYNPSYYYLKIDAGYSLSDNLLLPYFSKQEYFNVSYSISNFIFPLEIYPTQVGLFNEIGFNNTSIYLNIGPEARIERRFYFIPRLGISLIPFSKYDNEMAFVYYAEISAGFNFSLTEDSDLLIEAGTDFIKFRRDQNNFYFKIGIGFNLNYPL